MNTTTAGTAEPHGPEQAYEALAPVYDDFTAHHDYGLWLGELLPALRRRGLRKGKLLDVGCGTGKSFLPMLEQGWEVTGCDISASMLERARAKVGDRVELFVADMRELPQCGEFELVWTLDDALNYLLSADELVQALSALRRNLAPHGLLLFDVNSMKAYRTFFAETQVVETPDKRLVWRGQATLETPPGSIFESRFEVGPRDGDEAEVETHLHRQRHYPEAVVLEALEAAGLECLDVYGHDYSAVLQQPLDEPVHTKAIYISRRA